MTARANILLLAALSGVAACATGEGAKRAAAPSAPEAAPAGAPAPVVEEKLSPKAQRLFDEAVATLEDQRKAKVPTDWELLERKWRAAAAEGSPDAWFNVGVALQEQGKAAEARAAWERALQMRPTFREAAVNLALQRAAGTAPEAQARIYEEALHRFPEDPLLRVRLAELYQQSGQLDEAWRLAREALQRDPRAGSAYPVMMRVALARGDLDLAELVAVRARKLDPSDPEIAYLLGVVREKRGDEAGALAQYRAAVAQRPRDLPPRYRLLAMAMAARAWEAAAEQARAILAVKPDDARVRLALGIALRNLDKPEEALAEYAKARASAGASLPEIDLASGVANMKGKGGCAAAIPDLERYVAAVGPGRAAEGPAPTLLRECAQSIADAKAAEEAARQMRESDAKAAEAKAAAAATKGAPAGGTPAADTKGATPTEVPATPAPGARPPQR